MLYSPQTSLNGAKLLINKGPAKRPTVEDMSDAVAAPAIIIPGVTRDGEFTSGLPNKRKRDKERQDPRKSRRPELPVHGPGRGGRVGASATQHVVQNLVRDTTRDEDVRAMPFPVALIILDSCISLCPSDHIFQRSRHRSGVVLFYISSEGEIIVDLAAGSHIWHCRDNDGRCGCKLSCRNLNILFSRSISFLFVSEHYSPFFADPYRNHSLGRLSSNTHRLVKMIHSGLRVRVVFCSI